MQSNSAKFVRYNKVTVLALISTVNFNLKDLRGLPNINWHFLIPCEKFKNSNSPLLFTVFKSANSQNREYFEDFKALNFEMKWKESALYILKDDFFTFKTLKSGLRKQTS